MNIGFIVECTDEGPEQCIVNGVMKTFCPKDKAVISPMTDKGKLLEGAPGEIQRLLNGGCAKVFVIWDWHPIEARWKKRVKKRWRPGECRIETHELRRKLTVAGIELERVVLICVTQELEAWALADHQAIARVIAKRRKTAPEPVRKTKKPEQNPDPEQTLENIFRESNVELAKYNDVPAILEQAQANRYKRLKSCPSFVRLVEKLTARTFDQAVGMGTGLAMPN